MKRCCYCKEERDEAEFPADRRTVDGLRKHCSHCAFYSAPYGDPPPADYKPGLRLFGSPRGSIRIFEWRRS